MEENSSDQPTISTGVITEPRLNPINNQRGNLLILLSILVLLVVVGGGAYYLGTQKGQSPKPFNQQNSSVNTIPTNNQSSVSTTNPTSPVEQKSDMQTYTDNANGYSIKYPSGWVINAWPQEPNSIPKNAQSINFGKYKLSASFGEEELKKEGYLIEIWIDKGKTLNEVLQENDTFKNRAGYRKDQVMFNGLTAYKIYNTGFDFPRDRLVVESDGKVFSISLNYLSLADVEKAEAQNTYKLVINSFQFLK